MGFLLAGRRWVLETALTHEECVRRLKSKVRGMWETSWNAEKPLYGTVTRSGFAVQITTEVRGSGALNPYFVRGVFTPGAAGTTIRATYGVPTTYRLFVAGLVSFFLYMGWRVLRLPSHALPPALAPFFGCALFFLVLSIYRGIPRTTAMVEFDRGLILDALEEFLEARITDAPVTIS